MASRTHSISKRTWNASQSWHYEELLEIPTATGVAKIRIYIRSNAYDEQSSGVAERWDGARWQQITHRSGVELASRHGQMGSKRPVSYTSSTLSAAALAAFAADRDSLLKEAKAILC